MSHHTHENWTSFDSYMAKGHISLSGVRQHRLHDASEQAAAQPWVELEMQQLSAGSYQGTCTSRTLGDVHLVHESQNQSVNKSGILAENLCTVSVAYNSDPALRFSQFSNPEDSCLFFLPQATEFDVNVPGDVETLYVCLKQDKLLEAGRTLNARYWDKPPRSLQVFNTASTRKLATDFAMLVRHSHPGIEPGPLDPRLAERMLIDSMLLAMNSSTDILTGNAPEFHAHRREQQLVKKAREFMGASLQSGHIPSIVEICAQTGVSERTLQYAFRRTMQLTPVAFLRILRLNRVRSELLAPETPETTVTRVATAWGFLHLGKFSQDYRRMFGERPSETLARAMPPQ